MQLSKSLATRTAQFLRNYPPFSYLNQRELETLSSHLQMKYYAENDFLFQQGDAPAEGCYVVHKGQVEIHKKEGEDTLLVDMCEPGDTFGVRSVLSGNPFSGSARAATDVLVYFFPKKEFLQLNSDHAEVALHYASGFAAGMPVVREGVKDFTHAHRSLSTHSKHAAHFREEDVIVLKAHDKVVFCSPKNSVQEAAEIMAEYRVGSVVVANEKLLPIGIITNMDMARKVGTGKVSINDPVNALMSSPVKTIPQGLTVARVILKMMKNGIRHLVVTEDGTPESRFIGIVSEHDVLLAQGNNPAVLVKRMQKAGTPAELADIRQRAEELIFNYLEQEVSIAFITETMTELNDVLIRRAIEMSIKQLEEEGFQKPALAFAWMNLGSEGRGEQLLRTDQDNALIYEDPSPEHSEQASSYFLRLGKAVTDILKTCGFAHCPGEIMASNPKWNMPLSGWKTQFSNWMRTPDPQSLMHGTIFFDYRTGYGDESLTEALTQHLYDEMKQEPSFINFFAHNALGNPPPLSFLRNFIVERSGDHKNEFDIKLRGMMPLCDVARVLTLHHQSSGLSNTVARYERLANLEPEHSQLFEEAALGYELMIRYRALNGFRHNNSGRYIHPDRLNKIERQTLKYAFRTIEALQSILKTRFSLNMFGG